jgi:hypothetical protein
MRKDRRWPENVQIGRVGMRGIGEALPVRRALDGAPVHSRQPIFTIAGPRFVALAPMFHQRNRDGKADEPKRTGCGSQPKVTASRTCLAGEHDTQHQVGDANPHEPGQPAPQARKMPLLLGQTARVRGARVVIALHVGRSLPERRRNPLVADRPSQIKDSLTFKNAERRCDATPLPRRAAAAGLWHRSTSS